MLALVKAIALALRHRDVMEDRGIQMCRLEINYWWRFQGRSHKPFNFEDGMDDDAESDEEVETLRQGLLAVKIPMNSNREFVSLGQALLS